MDNLNDSVKEISEQITVRGGQKNKPMEMTGLIDDQMDSEQINQVDQNIFPKQNLENRNVKYDKVKEDNLYG